MTARSKQGLSPALGNSGHVTTRSMSPQHLRSPILTFATMKLSTGANGQKENAPSFLGPRSLIELSWGRTPCDSYCHRVMGPDTRCDSYCSVSATIRLAQAQVDPMSRVVASPVTPGSWPAHWREARPPTASDGPSLG